MRHRLASFMLEQFVHIHDVCSIGNVLDGHRSEDKIRENETGVSGDGDNTIDIEGGSIICEWNFKFIRTFWARTYTRSGWSHRIFRVHISIEDACACVPCVLRLHWQCVSIPKTTLHVDNLWTRTARSFAMRSNVCVCMCICSSTYMCRMSKHGHLLCFLVDIHLHLCLPCA